MLDQFDDDRIIDNNRTLIIFFELTSGNALNDLLDNILSFQGTAPLNDNIVKKVLAVKTIFALLVFNKGHF